MVQKEEETIMLLSNQIMELEKDFHLKTKFRPKKNQNFEIK